MNVNNKLRPNGRLFIIIVLLSTKKVKRFIIIILYSVDKLIFKKHFFDTLNRYNYSQEYFSIYFIAIFRPSTAEEVIPPE